MNLVPCVVIYTVLDVCSASSNDLLLLRQLRTTPHMGIKGVTRALGETKNGTYRRRGNDVTTPRFMLTSSTRQRRTTPFRLSFVEDCDYLAYYCLRAYNTGKLCGRTLYYTYHDFHNYCMLDYVNCMERYEVWQVAHMGQCFNIQPLSEYKHYPYENDYFLDQYYVVEDQFG